MPVSFIIIKQIGTFEITQSGDDAVNHLINPHNFAHHGFEFREQGVFLIGLIENPASVFLGCE